MVRGTPTPTPLLRDPGNILGRKSICNFGETAYITTKPSHPGRMIRPPITWIDPDPPYESLAAVPPPLRQKIREAHKRGVEPDELARLFTMPREWISLIVGEEPMRRPS